MAVTAISVAVIAALVCSTDAELTWKTPVTAAGTYTKNIKEGTSIQPPLIVAATTTAAAGTKITYTLDGAAQTTFKINATTGEITSKTALDYETEPNTYTITITATELLATGTPKSATATVTINVLDVPWFAKATESVCVQDGIKAGTVVAEHAITDTFGSTTYSITGDGKGGFKIDGGNIAVADQKTLNKEEKDSYNLTVKATNAPGTPTIGLKVQVGDCSAASLLTPLSLLTLLMAMMVSMN